MTTELPATFTPVFHEEDVIRKMPYNKFGRSQRLISKLSLGSSSFGNSYGTMSNEADCVAVTVNAVKQGINLIDTAPWYGHGLSETILGKALKNIPRSAYYLTTKVCRYHPGALEMFDFTYERTIQSVNESLKRLQLDYIDVIQIHDPEFAPSLDLVISEVLPALQKMKEEGKVKHIGITGYPISTITYLAEHCPPGIELESCLSYCRYNLHDTSLIDSGCLKRLTDLGLGVVNGSPYSMGLLVPRGPPVWHPSKKALKVRCAAAGKRAAEMGFDIAHLAFLFCLAEPSIATTMTSTTSPVRLQGDIDMVTGKSHHAHGEGLAAALAACAEIRKEFFSGPEFDQDQLCHWEGEEVNKYWKKVGQALTSAWYVNRIESMGRTSVGLLADGETLSTINVAGSPRPVTLNLTTAHAVHAPELYGNYKE